MLVGFLVQSLISLVNPDYTSVIEPIKEDLQRFWIRSDFIPPNPCGYPVQSESETQHDLNKIGSNDIIRIIKYQKSTMMLPFYDFNTSTPVTCIFISFHDVNLMKPDYYDHKYFIN